MRVFVCTDHDLHWPVGGGSVVVAEDEAQARALLDEELNARGLQASSESPYTLKPLSLHEAGVEVISDGQY